MARRLHKAIGGVTPTSRTPDPSARAGLSALADQRTQSWIAPLSVPVL